MAGNLPPRFMKRLKTLAARQAKVRDDLRRLQADVEEFEEASEALDTAIDALSRLA